MNWKFTCYQNKKQNKTPKLRVKIDIKDGLIFDIGILSSQKMFTKYAHNDLRMYVYGLDTNAGYYFYSPAWMR